MRFPYPVASPSNKSTIASRFARQPKRDEIKHVIDITETWEVKSRASLPRVETLLGKKNVVVNRRNEHRNNGQAVVEGGKKNQRRTKIYKEPWSYPETFIDIYHERYYTLSAIKARRKAISLLAFFFLFSARTVFLFPSTEIFLVLSRELDKTTRRRRYISI